MKKLGFIACLMTCGTLLLASGSLVPAAHANLAIASPASVAYQGNQPQPQPKQERNTFLGRIAQSSYGKFVLQESSSDYSFVLDNQEQARAFNGKHVRVTGTLDPSRTVIHVIDIERI